MKKETNISNILIFKKFWDGMRPYKWIFVSCIIAITLAQTVIVFTPIMYKRFFDLLNLGVKSDLTPFFNILYIIVGIHFLHWILWRSGIYMVNILQINTIARLRQNSFQYIIKHSHSFFAENFGGSLVQKVNRFGRAFENLGDTLIYNLLPLLVAIAGSVIVTAIEVPIVSIVIVAWIIFLVIFQYVFFKWKMKYDLASAAADSVATGVLSDDISNQNSITLYNGYDREVAYYKEVTDDHAKKMHISWKLGDIPDTVQIFCVYAVEFAIFFYATIMWQEGEVTLGTFVLIQAYVIGLGYQLWGLNRIVRNVYMSLADARELVEILVKPYDIKDAPTARVLEVKNGNIKFEDVRFAFHETRTILDGVSVEIKSGEKVALVGSSGAGKTTFVRLLLRMYDVTGGKIMIDNQDISKVTQESLRKGISLVPQEPILFHRTLLENIRYGRPDATNEEVVDAAKLANCHEFIEKFPNKYETLVGERGVKLSGGERQRVAIARAILKNAPILIFDEATSSLDSQSESAIQEAFYNLMQDRTTIVIAHRLSTIRKMDRIIVIDKGRIAEDGTHEELLNRSGIYKKLWDLQVRGFIK